MTEIQSSAYNCMSFSHKHFNRGVASTRLSQKVYAVIYIILPKILLVMLTQFVNEITGHHQCGFYLNRFTIDQILFIYQTLGKIRVQCDSMSIIYRLQESL